MRTGIVTIQKNRAPWIPEWIAFHHLAGVERFYFYAHNCTDDTSDVLQKLMQFYDIKSFILTTDQNQIQLSAYQHAYENFGHECDWLAFIDGDEFLFPVADSTIGGALERFNYEKISAIGAYWACFGSSGHVEEPAGLITKNYRYRHSHDVLANRHIKSIVRGRQAVSVGPNAHIFNTPYGTVDENRRSIVSGRPDYDPTYQYFRINHYVCQSLEYFQRFKQRSGAADAGSAFVRPDTWWTEHDRNEAFDDSLEAWYPRLEAEMQRIGFEDFAGVVTPSARE
ncbi:glycosyltransferase family 92 protein [Paraburkholderia sp. CNPSo 3281]|uniref:glycosyltransferase family 92 protein n=1 Tax=Paraburkholderia sp. CNPSo 3281 TaxID=2940933 RepID=UPI0020B88B99|nr:glycosyltransferase family 92 protein [Paraburkholderia sp. CNPSo 3281]MCP3717967.1 glycosyltransferase family 92 protein [Paraburkholderia sp. CNPSo 3281]